MIIAIDGPAGSGKSTTAKWVANKLGLLYLDTGAMFRAIAFASIASGKTIENPDFGAFVQNLALKVVPSEEQMQVFLAGADITSKLRTPEVGKMASSVATQTVVREKLMALQRETAQEQVEKHGGVVLDGRDIGTVVFPDADLKVFLTADARIRARRRVVEMEEKGHTLAYDAVLAEIEARDLQDATRKIAPLKRADDAFVLDTSFMDIAEQVRWVVEKAEIKMNSKK
ncbi:MAG: (d)CMP kinase [Rhodothermia bacterium]|nr:(d)CMP kinase [Rhodothermia bacterium]